MKLVDVKSISIENDLKQVDVARWRLTECQDMYPAHIDNGDLIHSATDKEIERPDSQGIKLDYELAHWALKTKAQIQSGTPLSPTQPLPLQILLRLMLLLLQSLILVIRPWANKLWWK